MLIHEVGHGTGELWREAEPTLETFFDQTIWARLGAGDCHHARSFLGPSFDLVLLIARERHRVASSVGKPAASARNTACQRDTRNCRRVRGPREWQDVRTSLDGSLPSAGAMCTRLGVLKELSIVRPFNGPTSDPRWGRFF